MNPSEMPSSDSERSSSYTSRLGLLISVLGIAIGTGNIWRFPRIAATAAGEGGAGGFLIAWVVFLFIWSIPLIVAEYALGRFHGKSVLVSFYKTGGRTAIWKGGFVVLVAVAIMAYYGVITGWCIWYFLQSASGQLAQTPEAARMAWGSFQSSMWPFVMQLGVFGVTGIVVYGGIRWIERINLVLIPGLIIVMLIIFVRAVTLDGAGRGISFLFSVDLESLTSYQTWMEALTQNAWDTGAGWGLIMSYAAFAGSREPIVKNAFRTAIANNTMSLVAAMMVFSTVFALLGAEMHQVEILGLLRDSGPATTGLTFLWIPVLFAKLPAGQVFATIFFLGLSMAAFTSFISMAQLGARTLIELGFRPASSLLFVLGAGLLAGSFSAADLDVLGNQDFVWGLGLMISGWFIARLIAAFGTERFAEQAINYVGDDWKAGRFWMMLIRFGIPAQVVLLLGWWTWRTVSEFSPETWMNPLAPYSVANCLMYWVLGGVVLKALTPVLEARINRS